jgi:hypothetical protein
VSYSGPRADLGFIQSEENFLLPRVPQGGILCQEKVFVLEGLLVPKHEKPFT